MLAQKTQTEIALVWSFGWAFVLLGFPRQIFASLFRAKAPSALQVRRVRKVGLLALTAGLLVLAGIASGSIPFR